MVGKGMHNFKKRGGRGGYSPLIAPMKGGGLACLTSHPPPSIPSSKANINPRSFGPSLLLRDSGHIFIERQIMRCGRG